MPTFDDIKWEEQPWDRRGHKHCEVKRLIGPVLPSGKILCITLMRDERTMLLDDETQRAAMAAQLDLGMHIAREIWDEEYGVKT